MGGAQRKIEAVTAPLCRPQADAMGGAQRKIEAVTAPPAIGRSATKPLRQNIMVI